MRRLLLLCSFLSSFSFLGFAQCTMNTADPSVTICTPANGATVTSPVHFVAGTTSSVPVASMMIYVDNTAVYTVYSNHLDTTVNMSAGAHSVDVKAWRNTGTVFKSNVKITVSSGGGTPPPPPPPNNTPPFGYVDWTKSPSGQTANVPPSTTMVVAGWAADREDGSPVAKVQVYLDGTYVGNATLGYTRQDVANGYNNQNYVRSGWELDYNIGNLAGGSHQFTAVAYDSAGASTQLTNYNGIGAFTVQNSGGGGGGGGTGSATSINHVIFMMQENRSFDEYFGMLNPYRHANGFNVGADGLGYDVDGIDDKLSKFFNQDDEGDTFGLFKFSTTCVEDMTASWLEAYGNVNRYNFSTSRPILLDGFVHDAEGYAKWQGGYSDVQGKRAMGYYDQDFLNYYYFMASQFALSDRWFSPVSSKTIPNRIATLSGGTTQGLVYDPSNDDGFGQLSVPTIFQELDNAGVSWKIYYTVTDGSCLAGNSDDCRTGDPAPYPATTLSYFSYAQKYLYANPSHAACTGNTQPSSAVGDSTNSFCIDTNHIAPISQFLTDAQNGKLPAFSYIEAGYGRNDEHPGKLQPLTLGQQQVASLVNGFMNSASWKDSVFFLSYDEGGGPFDHVPPVPGHTNDFTDANLNITGDIGSIAVNPDGYNPCAKQAGNTHCDLQTYSGWADPGVNSGDAPAQQGFAAQLGFRVPNMVISPFTKKHYVSHVPMDRTAAVKRPFRDCVIG
jgi:phospholipase C